MKVEEELRKKTQEGGSQQHSDFNNGMSKGALKKIQVGDSEELILLLLLM